MFDDLIRELKRLEKGIEVSVPVEPDDEGYVDKECPSGNCQFQFKVYSEDWTNIFVDEAVYCPLCGYQAPANSWWTKEQIDHANKQALEYAQGLLGNALRKSALSFNRRQSKSALIRISLEVKGVRATRAILPLPPSETLELKIQCEECEARFSVVGSAFFCPCCGHNAAARTFNDALRKVKVKIDAVPSLRHFFMREGKRDEGELLARSLIETCLADCVVGFQRVMEQLYKEMPSGTSISTNIFQRIDDGSILWKKESGKGYDVFLSTLELADLNKLFQRRHLLAHTEGIVDQRYLDRSGDIDYKVGQRIVVQEADVLRLAELVEKLVDAMKNHRSSS